MGHVRAGGSTTGIVLDWGWRYDLLVGAFEIITFGRLGKLRQQVLDVADVRAGSRVLDVGCGTGTLAIAAARRAGPSGHVVGIDPGPRQLARARRKAARARVAAEFQTGVIEQLPFGDGAFDAVLSTWMMHHLPDDLKRRGLQEIARVLQPCGRLVVLDAEHPNRHGAHASRHAHERLADFLAPAGFQIVQVSTERLTMLPHLPRASLVLAKR